jgi:hypothetical protein
MKNRWRKIFKYIRMFCVFLFMESKVLKKVLILLISLILPLNIYANLTFQDSEILVNDVFYQFSSDKKINENESEFGVKLISIKKIINKSKYEIDTKFIKARLSQLILSSNGFQIIVSKEDKTKEEIKNNAALNAKIEKSMKEKNPKNYTIQDIENEEIKADYLFFAEINSEEKVLQNGDKEITFIFNYKLLDKQNKPAYQNKVSIKKIIKKE